MYPPYDIHNHNTQKISTEIKVCNGINRGGEIPTKQHSKITKVETETSNKGIIIRTTKDNLNKATNESKMKRIIDSINEDNSPNVMREHKSNTGITTNHHSIIIPLEMT